MKAYFFNKKDELQKVIGEKNFIEAHLIEQINSASQLVFSLKKPLATSIQYVCIPSPNEDGFLMFKILTEEIKDSTIEYTCIEAAYNELASYGYVQDIRPNSRSASYMLEQVLQGTRWELGTIYDSTNATTNFYYEPVLSCIQDIVDIFGLELTFTVGITGNQITARRVNLYRQQGNRTGKRFEYGSNALEVAQETSTDELYTALVGRGKGEQVDGDNNPDTLDGYGRRITFADIEWKKSAGKPLDKPKGQEYLEDPDATKLYGFSDGKPRIGIVTFEEDEDKEVLLNHTYQKLQELKRPKVQFKASVVNVGDCTLGDTVAIIRHDFQIEYMTRIFKINHDLLDENNNTIELGDDLSGQDIVSKVNDVSSKLSDTQKQVSYVATTADGQHKVNYSATKPNTAKNGDLWYKDLGNGETELYIYNDGWQFVMSTKDTHDISDKVDAAMQEMSDKEKEINGKLESNQIDISQAQKDLEQAKQDTANQLADIRNSVAKDVADAKAQSKIALDKANGVDDKASQALENATEAKETVTSVATDMDTVKGEISSKADKSTVDTINQTVSDQGTKITQNANDIKSKASSSDVNKLKGTVETNETLLLQTAQGLTGKADTTQLNKLSGDLTTLSNNFSTTSAGFNASLSKIDDKVNSNKEETDSALQVARADIKATADNLSTNYTKTTDEHNYINSQIKESADKINLSVASVSDKIDANQTDTDSKIAALQIEDDQIKSTVASKVSSSDVQGMLDNGGYATQTWTGSEIDQKAGEISHTVTEVSNKVDNLSYENRNLVLSSADNSHIGITDNRYKVFKLSVDEMNSKIFTVSTYLKDIENTDGVSIGLSMANANDGLRCVDADIVKVGSNYYASGVIDLSGISNYKDYNYMIIYSGKGNWAGSDGKAITSYNRQVEKGTKATDWTPAPEDLATVTALSKVDQKADSISTTVTNNKTDADSKFTNVNQTISGIQSTVASKADASQITQLSNQINLKVDQTDFDNLEIGGRNLLPNSSFESSFDGGWSYSYMSNLFQKDGFIYIKKPNVTNSRTFLTYYVTDMSEYDEGEEYTFSIDFHTSTLDADGGSTSSFVRMLNANGSIIKDGLMSNIDPDKCRNGYTRFSGTGVIQKGTTKLQVTLAISGSVIGSFWVRHAQLERGNKATDWSPAPEDMVDKDGLVSQINIDKSGVLIQGKKIMIDGDTYIKNGVIKSAMIDTLDANKVTTGTLNAANVNIINMNANNITTGTLKGTNLSMNLNTGEVLFQKGSIKSTNGKLNISVDDGTMAVTDEFGYGALFSDGKLYMTSYDNFNNIISGTSKPTVYGAIEASRFGWWNESAGMVMHGSGSMFGITQDNSNTSNAKASSDSKEITDGRGLFLADKKVYLGGDEQTQTIVTSGKKFHRNNSFLHPDGQPFITVGGSIKIPDKSSDDIDVPSNGSDILMVGNSIGLNSARINYKSDTWYSGYTDWYMRDHTGDFATVRGQNFVNSSQLSKKTDIKQLDVDKVRNAIRNVDIREYRYKSDIKNGEDKVYASAIIDDVNDTPQYNIPFDWISADGTGRDDGTATGYLIVTVQDLYDQLDELKAEIKKLKGESND